MCGDNAAPARAWKKGWQGVGGYPEAIRLDLYIRSFLIYRVKFGFTNMEKNKR